MMDLVSPIWTIVSSSWGCIAKNAGYINDLKQKLASLREATDELKGIYKDIRLKVALAEENPRMVRSQQVQDWVHKVEAREKDVDHVLQDGAQQVDRICTGRCFPKNCWHSYKLGKKAVKFLGIVNDLKDKANFDDVAFYCSSMSIISEKRIEGLNKILMDKVEGIDSLFEATWRCLHDERLGIIGLYGMGGAGKTTLLKKINNELFNGGCVFDLVIWIVASKQAKVETIQDDILRKLCVPKDEQETANQVFSILQGRKFIIMLDDLWERIDLVRIGIPIPSAENKCKLIFTTRSEEVCGQMGSHEKIKVKCLTEDASWSLFREKVGEAILSSHPNIPRLAKVVARECDGLPLALVTIGRAMASRRKQHEWEHAIQVLRTYPSKLSGMGDEVLPVLKFSYDSLCDETIKICFLYCSLFPEDYEIMKHDLVDLWIGEGFLKEYRAIHQARNYGLDIIEKLNRACLLEDTESEIKVKMHDVVRDMAIWIACDCGLEKNRFLIRDFRKSRKTYVAEEWEEAERVSLWVNNVTFPESCHFPRLLTCMIKAKGLPKLPGSVFRLMPMIKVLDLSENKTLKELPREVCNLLTLQYLNLSGTSLTRLPEELRNLTALRYLLLDFMDCLREVPSDVISSLSHLRVFRMNLCKFSHLLDELEFSHLLDELETMKEISEIGISIHSYKSIKKLMGSSKLQKCMRYLRIEYFKNRVRFELLCPEYLETLHMFYTSIQELGFAAEISEPKSKSFPSTPYLCNLRYVIIYHCSQVTNLNFLAFAPQLQSLWVSNCNSLTEIISETVSEQGLNIFSSLKKIRLDNLPHIGCIYPGLLPCPCLEEVYVSRCPWLRKLPFSPNTRMKLIGAEPARFCELKWENDAVKSHFSELFSPLAPLETICGIKIQCHWPETENLSWTRNCGAMQGKLPSLKGEREQLLRASLNMLE